MTKTIEFIALLCLRCLILSTQRRNTSLAST